MPEDKKPPPSRPPVETQNSNRQIEDKSRDGNNKPRPEPRPDPRSTPRK